MVPELTSNKSVAIIGGGPAGCICAKLLQDEFDVTVFDKDKFLRTILPTGGGRCNLAHSEYDFKQLAKNYPRGEKFLYSIFSRFSTSQTIEFFESIGVKTYTQDDNRIFPVSNSANKVKGKFLNSLNKCRFAKEQVLRLKKTCDNWKITTDKGEYPFDIVVAAIGGHSGYQILHDLEINIIEPTQALVGLVTKNNISQLSGIKVPNVKLTIENKIYSGDILFTHKGVSGPVIYTISSVYARKEFPYEISIKFIENIDLQEFLNQNPHKTIENMLKQFVPKAVSSYILKSLNIDKDILCAYVGKTQRDNIKKKLEDFKLQVSGKMPKGEVVTCGGVDLKEVNPKTLESKKYSGLYFCGEVLDIDGFCGGFNLQNCWSTGYVVSESIKNCF